MKNERIALGKYLGETMGVDLFSGRLKTGTNKPYITFDFIANRFTEPSIQPLIIWHNSNSYQEVEEITEKLRVAISENGVLVPFDGGYITVYLGNPYAQHYPQPEDNIKAIYVNIITTIYKI